MSTEPLSVGSVHDRMQGKCALACLVTLVAAALLFVITGCVWGIHWGPGTMEPADIYCTYAVFLLMGMSCAFNMARKWIKNWGR